MEEYLTFFGIDMPTLAANFVGYPTSINVGQNVGFYDFSTGGITSWEWTFEGGNPSTSTEQNPVVFYDTPGAFDVTLIVGDGINTNTMTKTDYITVDYITGISEPGVALKCVVIPNPNNGIFWIKLAASQEDQVNLKIFNTMGTMVYSEEGVAISTRLDKLISLANVPNGVYILTIQGQHNTWTGKIVINK